MYRILFLLTIILSVSCSPKVTTHLSVILPPLGPEEQVLVINRYEDAPEDAEFLGTVKVNDSGATTKCDYDTVLSIATNEARKAGGNYLRIDSHKLPDIWSSCHRIEGSIFYLDHAYTESLQLLDNFHPQPSLNKQALSLSQVYQYPRIRYSLDIGFSYRIARAADGTVEGLTASERRKFINRMRSGLTYGIGITHFSNNSIWGVGAKFNGNHYSHSAQGYSDKVNSFYIGPELMARMPTAKGNAWIVSASIGYVAYRETVSTPPSVWGGGGINESGFKVITEFGHDTRISDNTFFGIKLAVASGFVPIVIENKTHREGLHALEIGVGLRF